MYQIKISSNYSRNQIITNLILCCGPFLAPKLFFIWLWNEARNRSLNEQWLCKFLISLESLLKFHKHISKILPWIFFWFGTRTFVLRCIDCQSAGLEGPNISPVPWSPKNYSVSWSLNNTYIISKKMKKNETHSYRMKTLFSNPCKFALHSKIFFFYDKLLTWLFMRYKLDYEKL